MFWKKRYPAINYSSIFKTLEEGKLDDRMKLLAFHESVKYLDLIQDILNKYKRPDGDSRGLSLYKTHSRRGFELIIINVPWNPGDFKFLPLILQRGSGTIYGIMLPFNEISPKLTKHQQKSIGNLAVTWTKFAMDNQFG